MDVGKIERLCVKEREIVGGCVGKRERSCMCEWEMDFGKEREMDFRKEREFM